MEVITLCLLRPCFREGLAIRANSLCVARAAVLEVITDGARKGGIIGIRNFKQAGDVIGTLSHSRSSSKERRRQHKNNKTVAFSPKNGQLEVATKPTGVSLFSHWEISLLYRLRVRRDGTDMIVDGAECSSR